MHGRFRTTLRDFAEEYAKKMKYQLEDEETEKEEDGFRSYKGEKEFSWQAKCKLSIRICLMKHIS